MNVHQEYVLLKVARLSVLSHPAIIITARSSKCVSVLLQKHLHSDISRRRSGFTEKSTRIVDWITKRNGPCSGRRSIVAHYGGCQWLWCLEHEGFSFRHAQAPNSAPVIGNVLVYKECVENKSSKCVACELYQRLTARQDDDIVYPPLPL